MASAEPLLSRDKTGHCPFAPSESLVELARARCPAFSEGCPFSATTSPAALKAALEAMPPSHADPAGPVMGVVEGERSRSGSADFRDSLDERSVLLADEWTGWWSAHAGGGEAPATVAAPPPPGGAGGGGGLAEKLKAGTAAAHAEAEHVDFVQRLLKGAAPLEAYVCLLAALARIYDALEAASARATAPAVAAVRDGRSEALARAPSLRADLAYYAARDPALAARAAAFAEGSAAASAYVEALGEDLGDGLVAHLYTRYLGDLSGGQILRRAVVRAYGLAPEGGTTLDARDGASFYDFPLIGAATRLRRFKDEYRETLDGLRVADEALVVAEAVSAFRRNTALLKEIDAVVLGAEEAAERHARPSSGPPPPNVCPFLAKTGDVAALGFGATCPVTGESAARKAVAANAGDAVCPLRAVGPRDLAIVAILFLAFACLLQGSPGLS